MKKTFLLILITAITAGAVYILATYVNMNGFLFAWCLNFLLMTGVLAFTETLKSNFTSPYFKTKDWEKNGKIYTSLGIHTFRKLLVWIGWEKLNKKANPVEKNSKALIHLYQQTKKSELGHLIIFFIVLAFNIFVGVKFGLSQSLWLLILNVLLNLYPIFLQRYNRPRLKRALKFKTES
jgi:hypothetical protein